MFRFFTLIMVFTFLVVPSLCLAALTDGLVSVWNFDDATANDALSRNDGILRGGATFSEGQSGKAADLNGVDAFVEVPHSDSMNGLENAFSVSAWAFFREHGNFVGIVWKGRQVGWAAGFTFEIVSLANRNPELMGWGACTADTEGWYHSLHPHLQTWFHVAQIADGKELRAYFNGELVEVPHAGETWLGAAGVGKVPQTLSAPYALFPDQPIRMGMSQGLNNNLDTKTYMNGLVDEVMLWDRALSEDEVNQVMRGEVVAVEPKHKLAVTWGKLKARRP